VLLAGTSSADKKKVAVLKEADKLAEIAGLATSAATAAKPCANYGWAAALVSVLKQQGVEMAQKDWIERSFGGDKCVDTALDFAYLARRVTGDYTLADGRHIRITAEWMAGAPESADPLIADMKLGRSRILVWNGKTFLLRGILYDVEYLTYNRIYYYMRELRLVDPMAVAGTPARNAVFLRDKDDAATIQGMLTVTVKSRELYELPK